MLTTTGSSSRFRAGKKQLAVWQKQRAAWSVAGARGTAETSAATSASPFPRAGGRTHEPPPRPQNRAPTLRALPKPAAKQPAETPSAPNAHLTALTHTPRRLPRSPPGPHPRPAAAYTVDGGRAGPSGPGAAPSPARPRPSSPVARQPPPRTAVVRVPVGNPHCRRRSARSPALPPAPLGSARLGQPARSLSLLPGRVGPGRAREAGARRGPRRPGGTPEGFGGAPGPRRK